MGAFCADVRFELAADPKPLDRDGRWARTDRGPETPSRYIPERACSARDSYGSEETALSRFERHDLFDDVDGLVRQAAGTSVHRQMLLRASRPALAYGLWLVARILLGCEVSGVALFSHKLIAVDARNDDLDFGQFVTERNNELRRVVADCLVGGEG